MNPEQASPGGRDRTPVFFLLAILGFSFWFFMAVPFASHRETYWWLAMVQSRGFGDAFTFISSTYRPLHQAATWLAFLVLDPAVFPTSIVRQTLLQLFVYSMFVLAWWLIYAAAAEKRAFALSALVVGGVFFAGYVHLFHLYGVAYVPVMLTLGALIYLHATKAFAKHEAVFAAIAILLVVWHPYATALFVGFYFGHYLDTFRRRGRAQHVRALTILAVGAIAVGAIVVALPRLWPGASALLVETATRSVDTRLFGFLVTYQTNEFNRIASLVAFLLAELVVLSLDVSLRTKSVAAIAVVAASGLFLQKGVPLLLVWLLAVLVKLLLRRDWPLFFLTLTAVLLPFGGGIGTPVYALFAITLGAYVTPLGWRRAEQALSFVSARYAAAIVVAAAAVVVVARAGIDVPLVTRLAQPLLMERERTYQLETILAWLQRSDYCGYDIAFADSADNPIDSVESALSREHRPPTAQGDVQFFWRTVLQCRNREPGTVIVKFGSGARTDANPVFEVRGLHAGDAAVWVADPRKS